MHDGEDGRAAVTLSGMTAWEVESEIISCLDMEAGDIDLHNWCDLTDLEESTSEGGKKEFTFSFRDLRRGRMVRLVFHGVARLELTESRPAKPEDAVLFHAFDYLGGGRFEFEAERASGRLTASAVSLVFNSKN